MAWCHFKRKSNTTKAGAFSELKIHSKTTNELKKAQNYCTNQRKSSPRREITYEIYCWHAHPLLILMLLNKVLSMYSTIFHRFHFETAIQKISVSVSVCVCVLARFSWCSVLLLLLFLEQAKKYSNTGKIATRQLEKRNHLKRENIERFFWKNNAMHFYRFGYISSPVWNKSIRSNNSEKKNDPWQERNPNFFYENVTQYTANTWSETLQPFCACRFSEHYSSNEL